MLPVLKHYKTLIILLGIIIPTGLAACATADRLPGNIHLVDTSPDNGFRIYRSARPNVNIMQTYCKLGLEEIMVIAGNAQDYEFKLQQYCPTLKVIFNKKQTSKIPLSESFLKSFDRWVLDARREGKIIAFRCDSGAHRTGRLAAYYQMKYNRLSAEDAKIIMRAHGIWMFKYPHLYPQVDALNDYIHNRPCSVPSKYCVQDE
jgi:hypothetical protein